MKLKDSQIIFQALADATRFRILNLLGEGELCVCDLTRVLKEPQSKVSRHLAYLRRSGLVQTRKEGLWMYYRLAKPGNKGFRSILKACGCCRSEFKELKQDLKVFRQNKKRLISCCT
ncbi:MAG: transcriptional regulator [Candidatus Omnitrophica bacterium CG11_big_fil_rev_8_21_14_0_20_45_26]|uniref:Transcriptional regulator n=1 Tax=Candidatus Abzuiibacterium crystallinum TaxID=1974748 RepID=A0A2H0LRU1_9BACT|nr:MAG: transcriptional regulator [Candidatus Omnitrophica bacterium CG11_big_fil_rev_8_21_14_0_20_45_26]PIW63583.1 MAG: ArsR family transcriptional regulator [Candidatus Omnitrophica bacterium CG12_big_fil_rev_8_21_14_0_65_45_16]